MVKIVETSVRDGHQSLFATRMTTEEVVKLCKIYDNVGYHAIEVWGGATFDACMRFLNEDPWERLRTIKKHMPKFLDNSIFYAIISIVVLLGLSYLFFRYIGFGWF